MIYVYTNIHTPNLEWIESVLKVTQNYISGARTH